MWLVSWLKWTTTSRLGKSLFGDSPTKKYDNTCKGATVIEQKSFFSCFFQPFFPSPFNKPFVTDGWLYGQKTAPERTSFLEFLELCQMGPTLPKKLSLLDTLLSFALEWILIIGIGSEDKWRILIFKGYRKNRLGERCEWGFEGRNEWLQVE